jgi:hypothetical protein
VKIMTGHTRSNRARNFLHRTWSVVSHLVDDVEPDRLSTVAPMRADGTRAKPFSQSC